MSYRQVADTVEHFASEKDRALRTIIVKPEKRMTKNNNENGAKIFYKKLAFAVFATLTPHRQPTPKNGLRHFSALLPHHPSVVA